MSWFCSTQKKKETNISSRIFLDKKSEAKIKSDSYIDSTTFRARTYLHSVLLTYGLIPHQESYVAAVIFVNNWIIILIIVGKLQANPVLIGVESEISKQQHLTDK